MIRYMLCPSCFCEIWALLVSKIAYDHLYYPPCFTCWTFFGSLVSATCKRTSCAKVHELSQSYCVDNQEETLFSWLHIHYTNIGSSRFDHSSCRGSLITINVMLLAWLVGHSLLHWYQLFVNTHHVPKCMSCHKAIVVITETDHLFMITYILCPSCFCEIWVI